MRWCQWALPPSRSPFKSALIVFSEGQWLGSHQVYLAHTCSQKEDLAVVLDVSVEMEYCEMLFRLETERSDKELYQIIVQSRPVQMISY